MTEVRVEAIAMKVDVLMRDDVNAHVDDYEHEQMNAAAEIVRVTAIAAVAAVVGVVGVGAVAAVVEQHASFEQRADVVYVVVLVVVHCALM